MDSYSARSQSSYYCSGLRDYLVKVYNYMALALGTTGAVAFIVSLSDSMMSVIYGTSLHWVISLAPVVMVLVMSARLQKMSMQATMAMFFGFAVVMGVSLSYVFMVYTAHSIARVFFISSSMFGAMAWYGNVTKRDLSKIGSFMIMGVVGILVASIVNFFLASSALYFAISLVSVLVFTVLTAVNAQDIKDTYYRVNDGTEVTTRKMAVMGATSLYFSYINMFLSLLHLMGDRR